MTALGAALAGGIALVRSGIRRDRWPFVTHMAAFAAEVCCPGSCLPVFGRSLPTRLPMATCRLGRTCQCSIRSTSYKLALPRGLS